MNKLLFWLAGSLPLRIIDLDGKPYLERYYVGQLFGVMFYLHRFLSGDGERSTHNHPWKRGGSVVLNGGYIEEVVTDLCHWLPGGALIKLKRVRFFNSVNGNKFHRIASLKPNTWTLFWHGSRERCFGMTKDWGGEILTNDFKGWGFLTQETTSSGIVTTYTPFLGSPSADWFLTAPLGKNHVDRTPL